MSRMGRSIIRALNGKVSYPFPRRILKAARRAFVRRRRRRRRRSRLFEPFKLATAACFLTAYVTLSDEMSHTDTLSASLRFCSIVRSIDFSLQ